jgi:hypothetical protein
MEMSQIPSVWKEREHGLTSSTEHLVEFRTRLHAIEDMLLSTDRAVRTVCNAGDA